MNIEKIGIPMSKKEINNEIEEGLREHIQKEILSKKESEEDFKQLSSNLLEKVDSKKEKMTTDEAKSIFTTLMNALTKIKNYQENNILLEERDSVLDVILPELPILETIPTENSSKNVGFSVDEYYYTPAAFSNSPLIGGEEKQTGVIGDQAFYENWYKNHKGQQLFVLPGVASSVVKQEDGSMLLITDVKSHTLRTTKLAALYLGGDFLVRDDGVEEGNYPNDIPGGYSIYKN